MLQTIFRQKRRIKIVALAVAAVFVLGVAGIALSQTGRTPVATAASGGSDIGYVNYQLLVSQHPDMAAARQSMQNEVDQAQKDFEAKTQGMSDQDKQQYYLQTQQRLSMKQQELLKPIYDKVDAAIKDVATAQGVSVVLDKSNVIYGGKDLTDDVAKKIGEK